MLPFSSSRKVSVSRKYSDHEDWSQVVQRLIPTKERLRSGTTTAESTVSLLRNIPKIGYNLDFCFKFL